MTSLQMLWKDRMDVFRCTEDTSSAIDKMFTVKVCENIPCKYSKGGNNQTEKGVPVVEGSHTLFCGLDTDIKEGDTATITLRNGKKISIVIGEGFPYTYCYQFSVKRSDIA